MKLRGFLWWVDRWRQSSAYTSMNLTSQAGYRNLLDECWLRGGKLPNDPNVLARACGDARQWPKIRATVLRWFKLGADGYLHNETLDEVLKASHKQLTRRSQQRSHMRQQRAHKRVNNGGDQDQDQDQDPAN